jgi:hypothetical protein
MEAVADAAYNVGSVALAGGVENFDASFLPKNLTAQCRSLIVSYHELHGYGSLPNILWRARLGHFIEAHQEFRQLLKRASTTRSAKKSNESFVLIATTILSLEILASRFAGWSAIYPEAGLIARAILQQNARSPDLPLMEFYLYPPKYISSAAIATLAPPVGRQSTEAESYPTAKPERSGEKPPLNDANAIHGALHGRLLHSLAASSAPDSA